MVFRSTRGFQMSRLITPLLQLIMFGMGTAMSARDFVGVPLLRIQQRFGRIGRARPLARCVRPTSTATPCVGADGVELMPDGSLLSETARLAH